MSRAFPDLAAKIANYCCLLTLQRLSSALRIDRNTEVRHGRDDRPRHPLQACKGRSSQRCPHRGTARRLGRAGQVRLFRGFETLVSYLKGVGIARFDVDAANFDPQTTRPSRPDRSDALKRAHEAAAYDTWFREQVQASIDDPRPSIPGEVVEAKFAAKRQALRKRIDIA